MTEEEGKREEGRAGGMEGEGDGKGKSRKVFVGAIDLSLILN